MSYEDLIGNETLKRALVRRPEVIVEASKNLSEDFRESHAGIGRKELAGLKDKLIHHYFGVNWKIVWDVIKNLIPKLKGQMEAILKEND